jgi:thioredoxin 1
MRRADHPAIVFGFIAAILGSDGSMRAMKMWRFAIARASATIPCIEPGDAFSLIRKCPEPSPANRLRRWRMTQPSVRAFISPDPFPFCAAQCRVGTRGSAMSEIKYVSDASFESDVLKAAGPVLVDYWAEWCGPCRSIAPILAEVAGEYKGKVTVAKLNVDENQSTPAKYGIRGIPTLMLFKDGAVVGTKVGALSKSQLTSFIDANL